MIKHTAFITILTLILNTQAATISLSKKNAIATFSSVETPTFDGFQDNIFFFDITSLDDTARFNVIRGIYVPQLDTGELEEFKTKNPKLHGCLANCLNNNKQLLTQFNYSVNDGKIIIPNDTRLIIFITLSYGKQICYFVRR